MLGPNATDLGVMATKLVLIGFHAAPNAVPEELHDLGLVAASLVSQGNDVVAIGDFNADCA